MIRLALRCLWLGAEKTISYLVVSSRLVSGVMDSELCLSLITTNIGQTDRRR